MLYLKIQIIETHLCAITVSHNSVVGGLYFSLLYVMCYNKYVFFFDSSLEILLQINE